MIEHGPIDVLVLAFPHPRFDGSVLAELEKQTAAGTIRVVDAMVLLRDEESQCYRVDLEDLPQDLAGAVDFVATETRGLLDSADADALFAGMAPGSTVVALAIEHTWAIPLVNNIVDAGVELAMNYRIPAVVVEEAYASLA